MSLKGLEQAIANLNSISNTAVPRASAQAVNRVATRAVSRSVAVVSKDTRVPRKLVKQRARIKRATAKKPMAMIRVNRGNLPA
ncbi:phage tail protein, partial [Citrobacter freundii]